MAGPALFIITGEQGEGKTGFALTLAGILKKREYTVMGFIAKGYRKGGLRTRFELTDLYSGKTIPLAERGPAGRQGERGVFIFNSDAVTAGCTIIRRAVRKNAGIIIVDEVGALELGGRVWSPAIDELAERFRGVLVITVRRKFLESVTGKWNLAPVAVFPLSSSMPQEAADEIEKFINQNRGIS